MGDIRHCHRGRFRTATSGVEPRCRLRLQAENGADLPFMGANRAAHGCQQEPCEPGDDPCWTSIGPGSLADKKRHFDSPTLRIAFATIRHVATPT